MVEMKTTLEQMQHRNYRQEYDITPDGWNPREHEVSREPIGDGNERVKYDDGYMRVVDKDGNVISHGFA